MSKQNVSFIPSSKDAEVFLPYPKPVSVDNNISLIILLHPLAIVFLILYMLLKYSS